MVTEGPAEVLHGRRAERQVLDRLLEAVRGGQSRVLVVSGEPGVGKTALVESAFGSASGFRGLRAAGVESEMELAFAALQLMCGPLMDRLDRLAPPQQEALGVAFGLRAGDAPDRFLVGLAVLSLLAHVAEDRSLVCIVVRPIGIKGLGEISCVGVSAAIANAIYHATGRRIRSLPITVERFL